MNLPIKIEEIKDLVKNNKIDDKFPYLENIDVMYLVIIEKPELFKLLDSYLKEKVAVRFSYDENLPKEIKKDILPYLISYLNDINSNILALIDTEDYYIKLAEKDYYSFCLLSQVNHNFKKKEKEIFTKKYENIYIYNPDYEIKYAKTSSKVLLNTLKNNPYILCGRSFFEKEAYNDEVIDYIVDNCLNIIHMFLPYVKDILYKYPKIVVNLAKFDVLFLLEFLDQKYILSDENLKEVQKLNLDIEKIITKLNASGQKITNNNLMLLLLDNNIDNIKYYDGELNSKLEDYLVKNNYTYREVDSLNLLKGSILRNLISNGDLNILFKNDIILSDDDIDLIIERLKKEDINVKIIRNNALVSNQKLLLFLKDYYKVNNPYNLNNNILVSNVGRSIEKLKGVFSDNDLQIIIREIADNNYYLDLEGIINHLGLSFKSIYDKLSKKENKFNSSFNVYYFIKVANYFSKHLPLLDSLKDKDLDDNIIDNLALVINHSEDVTYEELINYQEIFKNKIKNSSLSLSEKMTKLLVNGSISDVKSFLTNIANSKQIIYLQLEFGEDSYEYKFLETYLKIITLLENVVEENLDVNNIDYFMDNFKTDSLYDLKVMQENILKIYSKIYYKLRLDFDDLKKRGKIQKKEGYNVIDLTGERFNLFVHNREFNDQYDFTGYDELNRRRDVKRNYLCTTLVNEYGYDFGHQYNRMLVFNMNNPNSLISFGNADIDIRQTEKPLFKAKNRFLNPIDMIFLKDRSGYVNNEFDFLRVDDENIDLKSDWNCDKIVIDNEKHQEFLEQEYNYLRNNIAFLDYKNLYKLIAISSNKGLSIDEIEAIKTRINELSSKEQIVLNDALKKYKFFIKVDSKKY